MYNLINLIFNSSPIFQHLNIRGFENSRFGDLRIKKFVDSGIGRSEDSRIRGFGNSRIRELECLTFRRSKHSEIKGFTDSKIRGFKTSRYYSRNPSCRLKLPVKPKILFIYLRFKLIFHHISEIFKNIFYHIFWFSLHAFAWENTSPA